MSRLCILAMAYDVIQGLRSTQWKNDKFLLYTISIAFLELIVICRALGFGSCPFSSKVPSSDDHHHHHLHGGHSHRKHMDLFLTMTIAFIMGVGIHCEVQASL